MRSGPALDLQIDGRLVAEGDPRRQRAALVRLVHSRWAEVWLTVPDGPAFALLKSGDRALCLFLRGRRDRGFTSRQGRGERRRGDLRFRLRNGNESDYPAAWTVPFFVGLRAAEQFLASGKRPPAVRWHDDR